MPPNWPARRAIRSGTGDDPLAEVVTSGTGTDADAGEYLND